MDGVEEANSLVLREQEKTTRIVSSFETISMLGSSNCSE